MAGLISDDQIAYRTGQLYQLFQTVSRPIIVHKEPIAQFTATGISVLAGYGDTSQEDNMVYTPVSGIYKAQIVYDKKSNQNPVPDAQTFLPNGSIKIKVEEPARNFIRAGKTLMFEMDNNQYAQVGQDTVQDYLGLKFYYFTLAPLR